MNFKETLGVDISKNEIDAALHLSKEHKVFENNKKGFNNMLKWLKKHSSVEIDELLICFEHTGVYTRLLVEYLSFKDLHYVLESSLKIKRSMGLVRGKNDKIDAQRIAEYAYMRRESIQTTSIEGKEVSKLKDLLTLRDRLVRQKSGHQSTLKEQKQIVKKKDNPMLFKTQEQVVNYLAKQITKVEKEIKSTIHENKEIEKIFDLITSVIGVGWVVATNIIISTNCFNRFDSPRKYACYCGVAPFSHSSGTSIRGRTKVSNLANKRMKALLDLAARSAIVNDPELKKYYTRKVEEGKNKRASINAVRNKIIHRVFSVVRRGTPYVSLQR
ncbi:MAG: IS110 family transposase [Brumimicrobium sp.]